MSIPVPNPVPGKRPIPVPHEVAVPLEKDNRWKYGLAIALIVLLLLLLLLLLSFGAGSSGTGPGGSGQGGHSAGTGAGGEAGTTAAEGTGDGPAVAESTESDANNETSGETVTPVFTAEAENKTGRGNEPLAAATEPPSDLAIEELIRRLSAESDDDASSQSDTDRRSSQSGGDALVKGDATVHFFGATGKGSRFVFVFDRSSSMSGRPLESVKRELIKSLEPLRSNHSFNIISYDSRYEMWSPRLVSATPVNKANAIRFVEGTNARGGTQPREPLLEAIQQRPEIIFFMTDGEFTLDVDEITRNRRGIIINTVQFSNNNVPLLVLQELAKRTGGEFMLIPVRGLSDAL